MVTAVWSVKGGVGVSSVAALLALGQAQRAHETLVVDLCGDIPALFGVAEPDAGVGITNWCALAQPNADALARLQIQVQPYLHYLPRGDRQVSGDATPLLAALDASNRQIIVDCGVVSDFVGVSGQVVQAASTSLLVLRECFLNLRAANATDIEPTGVVVIKEPGRCLGRSDVEAVAGAPVLAEFAFDAAIARSIDAGLARARLPRQLVRSMGKVLNDVV